MIDFMLALGAIAMAFSAGFIVGAVWNSRTLFNQQN